LLNVVPSVLWHCWLGIRKSIWPTKNIEPDAICQQSVVQLNTELAPATSIMGISKANVQHLFSFVPKLSLSVINKTYILPRTFISRPRPRPRTWGQGQGQGLCYQGKGQVQGHSSLSSRSLEDEAKSSRTHHWLHDYVLTHARSHARTHTHTHTHTHTLFYGPLGLWFNKTIYSFVCWQFSVLAKRLAEKNVSEMTFLC